MQLTPKEWKRFWTRVKPQPEDGCWLWTAALQSAGYGVIRIHGDVLLYAHRVSFASANGLPYEATEHVHHKCHTPACVRPGHLEGLTAAAHMAHHHAGALFCRRGHSLEDAYIRKDTGARQCKVCRAMKVKEWQDRKRLVFAPKPCDRCGESFTPRNKRGAFCSQYCRQTVMMDRYKLRHGLA